MHDITSKNGIVEEEHITLHNDLELNKTKAQNFYTNCFSLKTKTKTHSCVKSKKMFLIVFSALTW